MNVNKKDISKEQLYESVKTLLEQDHPHLHLYQHKLFTLFSIGLQFLLFRSTKIHGFYIIRIEDSFLADKLVKKAKDTVSRKFLERILLPRKFAYGKSTFILDYFNMSSWIFTNDIPKDRLQGALIVKDSTTRPLQESMSPFEQNLSSSLDESDELSSLSSINGQNIGEILFPKDYYFLSLQESTPKTVIISFDHDYLNTQKISFPFIKEQEKMVAEGVTLSNDLILNDWKES